MKAKKKVKKKAKAKRKARRERVSARVTNLRRQNKETAREARERRERGTVVRRLADEDYGYDEIVEYLEDEGYDDDDIREAFVEADYDWEDALIDAIEDQFIDLDDADYYADLLDVDIGDIYDMYFGYGED